MIKMAVKFYANTSVNLKDKCFPSVSERTQQGKINYKTPEHNMGSNNLMVFIDGKLVKNYTSVNSTEILFSQPPMPELDYYAVVIGNAEGEAPPSGGFE